jgi:hypothetical protein
VSPLIVRLYYILDIKSLMRRQHRYDAGLDLDGDDATTRTSFVIVNSYASGEAQLLFLGANSQCGDVRHTSVVG